MTTTDPFTEAARAEAERRAPLDGHTAPALEQEREGLVGMAEWARSYLAAQENDDEAQEWENEVAAALPERYDGEEDQRDIILRAVRDMAARETQEPTEDEAYAAYVEWDRHVAYGERGALRCHCGAPGIWGTTAAHEQHTLWHALSAARRAQGGTT